MEQKQTRDLLIRNIPLEIYHLLERSAKENHRSKAQEAIIALNNGLTLYGHKIKKPIPFNWGKKITRKFIEEAINEGRE